MASGNDNDFEMEDEREEMMEEHGDTEEVDEKNKKAYIPSLNGPLKEGEELDFDPSAYKVFHSFETSWPCLTFDVVPDGLGDNRSTMPFECYIVSGTQAEKPRDNEIIVMGLKNLTALNKEKEDESDSDDSDDDEENENDDALLHAVSISHYGGINRIKVDRLGDATVAAVWNDTGKVQLWNVTAALNQSNAMTGNSHTIKNETERPLYSNPQKKEGYGLAWCPTKKGDFASGNMLRQINIYHMHEGGTWNVDQKPLIGHNGSVEDLVWSPTEAGLLASCSVDGCIKLWDTRAAPQEACVTTVQKAHSSDVNVISWNQHDSLILSGGDDGELKIWSLRNIQYGQPVARFKFHTGPITSVAWHPQDSTTFMASSEDDQTSIWDIATEADGDSTIEGVPSQLMFLHMGQKEVKEVHWHPQIPGLAMNTAISGFNVFKTINS